MNRATPPLREIARRIIALETKRERVSGKPPRSSFPVMERLRPHLSTLMGNTGFRALLMRSLALTQTEVSGLRALQVAADGALTGGGELLTRLGPEKFFEARVVLIAHLLGLLVAFIGEQLTLRLVADIWPKLLLNDLNPGTKDENEKAS